jgi:competence protein ComEC
MLIIGGIQLFIIPAQVYFFNYLNLNAFIGNLLGAVFISLLLHLFIFILLIPAWFPLYDVIILSTEFIVDIFNQYAIFMSKLPFIYFISQGLIELILMFILLLFGALLIVYHSNRKNLFHGMIITLLAFSLLIPVNNVKDFKIIFFNTGNSDLTLIRFSESDYMLIDTAEFDMNNKSIERNLLNYLRQENIRNISKFLLTHEHSDHYGGVFKLAENVQIDTLIITERFYNSPTGMNIRGNSNFSNTTYLVINDTLTYHHANYSIKFLHPDKNYDHRNENNHSIVANLSVNCLNILFTGDIEAEAENHLVSTYSEYIKADILKAAHHGPGTSTTESFLLAVNPELYVVPSTGNMRRGFPNRFVIQRVEEVVQKVYITGRDGAVVVKHRE